MNIVDPQPESSTVTSQLQPAAVWEGHIAEDSGATGGPLPCATLTASVSEICIRGTRGEFRVPRSAVLRISKGKLYPWLFRAIQIHHNQPRCSRELQFKPTTAKLDQLFDRLKALGYPVR